MCSIALFLQDKLCKTWLQMILLWIPENQPMFFSPLPFKFFFKANCVKNWLKASNEFHWELKHA